MASLITRLSKNSAKTEGKPRILTLAALIFVPLIVVGTLMWGLWNPTDRLDNVTAAIVNNDEPVTINGQLTPLGRLLTAGLVDGADGVRVRGCARERGAGQHGAGHHEHPAQGERCTATR